MFKKKLIMFLLLFCFTVTAFGPSFACPPEDPECNTTCPEGFVYDPIRHQCVKVPPTETIDPATVQHCIDVWNAYCAVQKVVDWVFD